MKRNQFYTVMLAMAAVCVSASAAAESIPGEVPLVPYVFGTVGAAQDGLKNSTFNDRDARVAGQAGVGLQLDEHIGGEVYYQGGQKFKYQGQNGAKERIRAQTVGTRATFGTSTKNKARVFAKVGVVAVDHDSASGRNNTTRPQFTAGIGASYNVTDNFAIRGDYDHVFKRHSTTDSKGSDYAGFGGQVNF